MLAQRDLAAPSSAVEQEAATAQLPDCDALACRDIVAGKPSLASEAVSLDRALLDSSLDPWVCLMSAARPAVTRRLNPPSIRAPFARYSHGLAVEGATQLVFASGQLGVAADDTVPDDVEAQCVLCFENLKAILAEAGMGFEQVVRFTAYVTDRSYFPIYGAVRSRYVTGDAFASTLLVVVGFTRPEFKVEVEVTAAR